MLQLVLFDFLEIPMDFSDEMRAWHFLFLACILSEEVGSCPQKLFCSFLRCLFFRRLFYFSSFKSVDADCFGGVRMQGSDLNDIELVWGGEICIISNSVSFCSNVFLKRTSPTILSRCLFLTNAIIGVRQDIFFVTNLVRAYMKRVHLVNLSTLSTKMVSRWHCSTKSIKPPSSNF